MNIRVKDRAFFGNQTIASRIHTGRRAAALVTIVFGLFISAAEADNVVTYTYDAGDRLTSVVDARGQATTYTIDGLGQLWQLTSPDAGVSTNTFDGYGRLASSTRADGVISSFGFDALNRVITVSAGGVTHTFAYDTCPNGEGRLCSASDPTGTSSFSYSPQGWIVGRGFSMGGTSYSIGYGYNNLGQLASIAYPDGNTATYGYTNGVVTSVLLNVAGVSHNVASGISYAAGDGQMSQWTAGNGLTTTASYDWDGRLTRLLAPGVQDTSFSYDVGDRLSTLTDAIDTPMTQSFGYDDMSRLTLITSAADNEAFQYDSNGNRTSETINALTATVTIAPSSNRLLGLSGGTNVSYAYDDNGNINVVSGSPTFHFDAFNHLDSTTNATYYVSAQGTRLRKTVNGISTYFAWDSSGNLIAESTGGAWSDYVWLNGRLIARLVAGQIEAINTDQTGRPLVVTNSSGGVVWRARNYAFDRIVTLNNTAPLNLGFPGQYYDQESGLWHNGYRDYSASLGRYIESDPIGMAGGTNTYSYTDADPLLKVDPSGLFCVPEWLAALSGSAVGGAVLGGLTGAAETRTPQLAAVGAGVGAAVFGITTAAKQIFGDSPNGDSGASAGAQTLDTLVETGGNLPAAIGAAAVTAISVKAGYKGPGIKLAGRTSSYIVVGSIANSPLGPGGKYIVGPVFGIAAGISDYATEQSLLKMSNPCDCK